MTWMTAWWIFDLVVLLVVVPVVVFLLVRMLLAALKVKRGTDELAASGGELASRFEGVEQLARTNSLLRQVSTDLERYGNALDDLR
jgi:uncharacterized membrane-anchored protein YhcB (DUF1043 family)